MAVIASQTSSDRKMGFSSTDNEIFSQAVYIPYDFKPESVKFYFEACGLHVPTDFGIRAEIRKGFGPDNLYPSQSDFLDNSNWTAHSTINAAVPSEITFSFLLYSSLYLKAGIYWISLALQERSHGISIEISSLKGNFNLPLIHIKNGIGYYSYTERLYYQIDGLVYDNHFKNDDYLFNEFVKTSLRDEIS